VCLDGLHETSNMDRSYEVFVDHGVQSHPQDHQDLSLLSHQKLKDDYESNSEDLSLLKIVWFQPWYDVNEWTVSINNDYDYYYYLMLYCLLIYV